ncbi:MAG TPA: hypothetical protein VIV63_04365, partial [Steroidobacteraceae bacterium]
KVFSGSRWTVPVALAATLLLAFTVVFQAGMPARKAPTPEVTVQNVAQETVAAPPARSAVVEAASRERSVAGTSMDAPVMAHAGDVPAWRRDAKSWQAEIQRLRDAGDNAAAEAELAEFKRQQRAYAVAPDR